MKTYKIKNYKGNLVESLSKFQESHKDMKVIGVLEENNELKINTEMLKEADIEDEEAKDALIDAIKDNCNAVAQCIASSTKALKKLFIKYGFQFRDAPVERSGDWVLTKFMEELPKYVDTLDVPIDDDDIDQILHLTKEPGIDYMDNGWGDKKDVIHKPKSK